MEMTMDELVIESVCDGDLRTVAQTDPAMKGYLAITVQQVLNCYGAIETSVSA